MTRPNIEAMVEAAKAATPGPWKAGGCSGRMIYDKDGYNVSDTDLQRNANHVITANPKAVLDLCAYALEIEADNKRMREALGALGAMPEGYCFCFGNRRDPLKPEHEHTGECRDARAALDARDKALVYAEDQRKGARKEEKS